MPAPRGQVGTLSEGCGSDDPPVIQERRMFIRTAGNGFQHPTASDITA
jgi:hypothetical protein